MALIAGKPTLCRLPTPCPLALYSLRSDNWYGLRPRSRPLALDLRGVDIGSVSMKAAALVLVDLEMPTRATGGIIEIISLISVRHGIIMCKQ